MRIPPSDTVGDITITVNSLLDGTGESTIWCEKTIPIKKFLHRIKPTLMLGEYTPTLNLLGEDTLHTSAGGLFLPDIFSSVGYAQEQKFPPRAQLTAKEARPLIDRYLVLKDPAAQMYIRESLSLAVDTVVLTLVDSLKISVLNSRRKDAAKFASLLSAQPSLRSLTSAGQHKDRLDSTFYYRAVEFLHSGNDTEARNMALFLRKLQDSRSLTPIFNEFNHSESLRTKSLCLYILGSFAYNLNEYVKKRVSSWLEDTLRGNQSTAVQTALESVVMAFRATASGRSYK